MNGKISVKIQCTVEMPVGNYTMKDTMDMEKLLNNAKEEGVNLLHNAVRNKGGTVIGNAKVQFVAFQETGTT